MLRKLIESVNLLLKKKRKESIENIQKIKKVKMNVFISIALATIALQLLRVLSLVLAGPTGQYFVSKPADMTTKQGDHLKLECVVANMQGECQWTKDGFGLGTDPTLPGFHRISMDERQARRRQLPSEHIPRAH